LAIEQQGCYPLFIYHLIDRLTTTTAPTINTRTCNTPNAGNNQSGIPAKLPSSGRSVGTGAGAGGVSLDPNGGVGVIDGVGVEVGDGFAVDVGSSVEVDVGSGVSVGGSVSVGSGVAVSVGVSVLITTIVASSVGALVGASVAIGVIVGSVLSTKPNMMVREYFVLRC
jgi:hypothetical protein